MKDSCEEWRHEYGKRWKEIEAEEGLLPIRGDSITRRWVSRGDHFVQNQEDQEVHGQSIGKGC